MKKGGLRLRRLPPDFFSATLCRNTTPITSCGKGLTAVAFYHSHPNGPNLSPSDIGFSNDNNLPIAGGAVGAKYFWLYSQSYGTILTEY